MKHINVIKTISPQERKACHRWFWFSCTLFLIIIISGIIVYARQTITLQRLQKEYRTLEPLATQLETYITEKRNLKITEEELNKKVAKIRRVEQTSKNPASLLHILMSTIPQDVALKTAAIKKRTVSLVLLSPAPTHIFAYIKHLKDTLPCSHIDLQQLEFVDNGYVKVSIEAIFHAATS